MKEQYQPKRKSQISHCTNMMKHVEQKILDLCWTFCTKVLLSDFYDDLECFLSVCPGLVMSHDVTALPADI